MENKKQIENNLRNKIAKQYTNKINNLQERLDKVCDELYSERKKRIELQTKNEELEDKISQYEDWINRLQNFCNLNDEDRENAIEDMKYKTYLNKKLASFMSFCDFGKFLV